MSKIIEITPINYKNYDKNYFNDGETYTFLKIYHPSCGYCNQMKGEWEKVQEKYNNRKDLKVVSFHKDCNDNRYFNKRFEILGVPSILLLDENGNSQDYNGKGRQFEDFDEYISSKVFQKGGSRLKKKYSRKKRYTKRKRRYSKVKRSIRLKKKCRKI